MTSLWNNCLPSVVDLTRAIEEEGVIAPQCHTDLLRKVTCSHGVKADTRLRSVTNLQTLTEKVAVKLI